MIVVLERTDTLGAAIPPIVTKAPAKKPAPWIVTDVSPLIGPEPGVIPVTVGPALYVNPFARLPDWLSELVTITVTGPGACAGVVAVMAVLFTTTTLVPTVPPNLTVAPA